MCLHKKGIQVANILQVMADGIQVDEEVHIKVEATNTQAQAIITVDTNIKFAGRNTAANIGFCNIGAGRCNLHH